MQHEISGLPRERERETPRAARGGLKNRSLPSSLTCRGAPPIPVIVAAVVLVDGLNGVSLGLIEPSQLAGPLPRLPGPTS